MSERSSHSGSAGGSGITLLAWKPVRRGTLCGFCTVRIERIGLVVADVAVHLKNQSRWASLPSKSMLDSAGSVLRDESTGKVRHQPLLQWADRKTADRFGGAVVAALIARHLATFDGDAP